MSYPPPPGYPPPEPYQNPGGKPEYWQESPKSKGLAVAALVFAILAVLSLCTVVGGILFGLIAVVLGVIAAVKVNRGTAGGGVMTVIALILGVGSIIAAIVLGVVGWGIFEDSGGQDFIDCVNRSGGDQAAVTECEDRFNQQLEDRFGVTIAPPQPAN